MFVCLGRGLSVGLSIIVFTLVTSFQKLEDMSWKERCVHLAIILANCFIPKIQTAIINMLAENLGKTQLTKLSLMTIDDLAYYKEVTGQ